MRSWRAVNAVRSPLYSMRNKLFNIYESLYLRAEILKDSIEIRVN